MQALAALADPTRRQIVALLAGGEVTAGDLASRFPVSRPAVSRHLRVLRDAGLVVAEEVGREWQYRLDVDGLAALHESWFAAFEPLWDGALERLRSRAERPSATTRKGKQR